MIINSVFSIQCQADSIPIHPGRCGFLFLEIQAKDLGKIHSKILVQSTNYVYTIQVDGEVQ